MQELRRERLRERALSKRKIEEDVLKAELEDEQRRFLMRRVNTSLNQKRMIGAGP